MSEQISENTVTPHESYGVEEVSLFDEAQRMVEACEETGADVWEMANSYVSLATLMRIIAGGRGHNE